MLETQNLLPADTHIGRVHLRVASVAHALQLYQSLLGMEPATTPATSVTLSADAAGTPLLALTEAAGVQERPEGTLGLYHFALLYPDRGALGRALRRLIDARWPFTGFADHGVSEAAYLTDADGNGIELYADRPRAEWPREGERIVMYTRRLDLESVLHAGEQSAAAPADAPRMGHVHLHVTDLARAEAFYADALGFAVTERNFPGALFVAAGGYHHHIGLNTWAHRPQSPHDAGLIDYEVVLPSTAAREELVARLAAKGIRAEERPDGLSVRDPDGNVILLG